MTVREYIEQAIDRFLLYFPTWYVDYDEKERFIRRYEKKYEGNEIGRCRMDILERLESCWVVTPWTKQQRLKWIDNAAWHETGHMLGYFILNCPPQSAYINDKSGGQVMPSNDATFIHPCMKKIALVGGWALERKHASVELCKDSIGYGITKFTSSDWVQLDQPTVQELESLSVRWFYRDAFKGISRRIHDEFISHKRLSRKRILELYNEFLADEKARKEACFLRMIVREGFISCQFHPCKTCDEHTRQVMAT